MKKNPLDRDRWLAVSAYLDRAMEMPREELSGWLTSLRAEIPEVADDLEILLRDRDALGRDGFLEEGAPILAATLRADRLDRWGSLELLEKVGEGGFGETYRARDPWLEREVALKLLFPDASRTAEVAGRVIREGALLARVSHPNVVTVLGAERHEGRVGMWMELIRGQTLEDILRARRPFGERETILIGLDLCRALAAVHRSGIVHGDVKASNVMREEGGRIVLMDFGAGVDVTREEGPERHGFAGTPQYMAPEQLGVLVRGSGARSADLPVTKRSDLYSLGVLLFYLVSGHYPVSGTTLHELAEMHDRGKARRLSELRSDLTKGFVAAVDSCLARDPAERIETPGALESALVGALVEGGRSAANGVGARWPDSLDPRSTVLVEPSDSGAGSQDAWTAWRRTRIAEWSRSRYRLDKEFVALTLLLDQGETATKERWNPKLERYRDLREVLAAVSEPALVVLGAPGCGKSTLLRRLELELAQEALARKAQEGLDAASEHSSSAGGGLVRDDDPITFFVELNHYRPVAEGPASDRFGGGFRQERGYPDPEDWLTARWAARFPWLPPLPSLRAQGRLVLLLDGLNEIPAMDANGLREAVVRWKKFIDLLAAENPANRVVFSCRTLDYSAPLSTPSLRVPQVMVEPMTDQQVKQYLQKYDPAHGGSIWSQLVGTPQLEAMRSPYFLSLLLDEVRATGELPNGRALLFTRFVRQGLKREVERDNPLFAPGSLLTDRDVRRIARGLYRTQRELPERGVLIPRLSDLAFRMQDTSLSGGSSQVRIAYDRALDFLAHDRAEEIVRAGVALSVLDEDAVHDEVLFYHQLVQEYFAGRRLAVSPEPARVRVSWSAAEIVPTLRDVLRALPHSETLPLLATTGWEETALLAAELTEDPEGFVRGLMDTNLALAGRCAAQPEVRGRLTPEVLDDLKRALVERSRDGDADIRARIAAGLALGPLGDPRWERRRGPQGEYLMPPLTQIPAGRYPMGEDEPFVSLGDTWTDHMPHHEVQVAAFLIGRFPVTNAEWALFMEAGGYEDGRWWDTPGARRWQSGEGTAEGIRANVRYWLNRFRTDPRDMETRWSTGTWTEEIYERWRERLAMSEAEFEAHLTRLHPGGTLREPTFWHDSGKNNPSQPVVGVCWFEARAYASWLSAKSGLSFRLPTEAEWEAAARGREGRAFSYDGGFDPLKGNTSETRIQGTSPVGVFVEGDTPEGLSDLTGNVEEWTVSLFGAGGPNDPATFRYPYTANDGREDPFAGNDVRRVLRGGAWNDDRVFTRAAARGDRRPDLRPDDFGFRLAAQVG